MSGGWRRAARWAWRELDPRFRGLRLLVLCLFLGVAALAAVGGLAGAIGGELAARGATILGGDIELSVSQRRATPAERAAMARLGTVSETIRMQANAVGGSGAAPIQLKGVDAGWPLYGRVRLADGRRVGAPAPGRAYVAPALAERLAIGRGAALRIGERTLTVDGILADEPDRLGEGFTLGPPVLVTARDLAATGLVQPGSLYDTRYRLRLPSGRDPATAAKRFAETFPAGGWETKTRDRASPGASRFVDRMGDFLTLVALSALVIAGVGVGGGVSSFLAARRPAIATLKTLGATGGDIARLYAIEIGGAASLGIVAGLAVGAGSVPLLAGLLRTLLPVPVALGVSPGPLLAAAAYGALIAVAFAATPIAAAAATPAAGLLRGAVAPAGGASRRARAMAVAAIAGVALLAITGADRPMLAAGFLLSVAGVLLLLVLIGIGIRTAAARLPRPRRPLLRLAVAALHRPGARTVTLVVALGLGFTLFVMIAAVRTSIDHNIATTVPARAPALFVLDVPRDREAEFRRTVAAAAPGAEVRTVPLMRGTITGYRDVRVADLKTIPEGAWALRGERGLTYADALPPGNTVTAGRWWPPGYAGPPLVSVDERLARVLNLKVGDPLTISLLGVERTARIASLRRIDWDTLGFNFVLVFSPGAIADAPHNLAATVDVPDAGVGAVTRALLAPFPSASAIEVRGVLDQVRGIVGQVAAAIAAAGGVVVAAGIAVLAGAVAAAREARLYDGVILRVLGATRWQLLAGQTIEYALLGGVVGAVSLGLGLAGAWWIVVRLFGFVWAPDMMTIAATIAIGFAGMVAIGLIGSWSILGVRPARALRSV